MLALIWPCSSAQSSGLQRAPDQNASIHFSDDVCLREIEHIEAAFRVHADNDMHGIIAAVVGHGIIGGAVDRKRFARGGFVVGFEPIGLEIIAGVRRRPLLI